MGQSAAALLRLNGCQFMKSII